MKRTIIAALLVFTVIVSVGIFAERSAYKQETPLTIPNIGGAGSQVLMSDGAGGDTETGDMQGQIFIVNSIQSFRRSQWQLLYKNWPVSGDYESPILHYDRTSSSHEKVTWNVLDATFIVIDEGTFNGLGRTDGYGVYDGALAVLVYTVDGRNYINWTNACYGTPCFGGSRKWLF